MELRYASELLEEAVPRELLRRESAGDDFWTRDFHRYTDGYYDLPEMDRDGKFREAYAKFFRHLGLAKPVETVAAELASLRALVSEIVLDRANGSGEEEADLCVEPDGTKNVRIRLRVARFDDLPALEGFLRHEMRHVQDMLRPDFQYRPCSRFAERPAEENLVRARLRWLWNLTAAGALARAGRRGAAGREEWAAIGARLYPAMSPSMREKIVERFWNAFTATWPMLIDLACRPDRLLQFAGVAEAAPLHGPGALCPLCSFSTFSWADCASLSGKTIELIRADFPGWSSSKGACRQCADAYVARTTFVTRSAV